MVVSDSSAPSALQPSTLSPAQNAYQYPFAAAPDIIRSHQKDAYFQGLLLENLSSVLRRLYGARFIHKHTSEVRTFTDLLYLACTTLIGNRTLGEEYCDIVQVEGDTLQLPSIYRRGSYILSAVLFPHVATNILPGFRNYVRSKLESSVQHEADKRKNSSSSLSYQLQLYVLENLSVMTSPSPFYALGLSVFYFTGAYYHISKRMLNLRYIFTKRLEASEQRIGYEVLGFLLVLQMTVQGWLHLQHTMRNEPPTLANVGSLVGGSATIDGGVEIRIDAPDYGGDKSPLFENTPKQYEGRKISIEASTHTPILQKPRYGLKDQDNMGWIEGQQQRKCTLCLEELKDPSLTTCGHVFCWSCIADWIREKPECPLCRQGILSQHVLPLRG